MINRRIDNQIERLIPKIRWHDGRTRHASFLATPKNLIVAMGINQTYKSHPLAAQYNYVFPNIHSELQAIVNACRKKLPVSELTMYNIRVLKDGSLGYSKPCQKCQELIVAFGIKRCFYSNYDKWETLWD